MFWPEHIFINRMIKLPLERSWKYKKEMTKGGGKKNTKPKRHLWFISRANIRSMSVQNSTERKKKKGAKQNNTKTAAFTAALLSPRRGEVPPVHVQCSFSLAMALASRCANHKLYMTGSEIIYIYIYKKTKNIKQCENSDHLKINKKKRTFESSYYYYFCYHTESAISHQQWFQLTVPIAAQCHNTI